MEPVGKPWPQLYAGLKPLEKKMVEFTFHGLKAVAID
jgi:hypothetical protein